MPNSTPPTTASRDDATIEHTRLTLEHILEETADAATGEAIPAATAACLSAASECLAGALRHLTARKETAGKEPSA